MKRYTIMARPYRQDFEVEVCKCDERPDDLVKAVRLQKIAVSEPGKRKKFVPKYEFVHVVDHGEPDLPFTTIGLWT